MLTLANLEAAFDLLLGFSISWPTGTLLVLERLSPDRWLSKVSP